MKYVVESRELHELSDHSAFYSIKLRSEKDVIRIMRSVSEAALLTVGSEHELDTLS